MKSLRLIFSALCVVLMVHSSALAQSGLDPIADRIKDTIEGAEPGWKCERGQPSFTPQGFSPRFMFEVCSLHAQIVEGRSIREVVTRHVVINVSPYGSEDEARQDIRRTVSDPLNKYKHYQPLKDLGDEAYTYGLYNSEIFVRAGRFVVDVTTSSAAANDPDGPTLSLPQKEARDVSERRRLGPLFAQHALAALQ